ncbi:hypothetical protein [Magnetospira sp. QH-2]|uniref:hypothetical protein n=1 Tax=Magnetospira sp. (strain QH-2) TaxID=1288970 RepID=UPI0003E80B4A|nr:hypothetical protein [Magnetospira sp. QH-2]CCQ75405.1 exported protein of unknown function [Magnetospira sp. QH-2]
MGVNWKNGLAALALLGATACTEVDLVNQLDAVVVFPDGYMEQASDTLAATDWTQAQTHEILFLEDDLKPTFVSMKRGQPYILKLVNTIDNVRTLAAADFFQNAAASDLTGSTESDPLMVVSIALAAKETREIKVVPMNPGRYRFNNETYGTYVPFMGSFTSGVGAMSGISGVFIVEE